MVGTLTGSSGRSIVAQSGFVAFLIASFVGTVASGTFDIYAVASLLAAVPFVVLIWFSIKGNRFAFIGSAVLSFAFLFLVPFTLVSVTDPILIWVTSLSSFLLVLVVYEGIVAFSEMRST